MNGVSYIILSQMNLGMIRYQLFMTFYNVGENQMIRDGAWLQHTKRWILGFSNSLEFGF